MDEIDKKIDSRSITSLIFGISSVIFVIIELRFGEGGPPGVFILGLGIYLFSLLAIFIGFSSINRKNSRVSKSLAAAGMIIALLSLIAIHNLYKITG